MKWWFTVLMSWVLLWRCRTRRNKIVRINLGSFKSTNSVSLYSSQPSYPSSSWYSSPSFRMALRNQPCDWLTRQEVARALDKSLVEWVCHCKCRKSYNMVAVDGLSSLLTSVSEPNSLTACGPIHWCSLENVWKNPLQALCVASAPCSLYPHLTSLCENTALLLSLCHFFPFRLLVTEGAGIGERRHNQPVSVSATCRNSRVNLYWWKGD